MILLSGFALDFIFLILKSVKAKSISVSMRFVSYCAVINALAYYMITGLDSAFGVSILFEIICVIAAKIFVVLMFITVSDKANRRFIPNYIVVTLVSFCIHENAAVGIISAIILLLFILYTERSTLEKAEGTQVQTNNESGLYLKTVEDNYRKNRALMHDLNNHIIAMRSLAENKHYDELESYINSLSEKVSENIFPVKSGNIVLDSLLADKYHRARRDGTFIEFEAVNYNIRFSDEDLCAVVGNLFDNAIEENLRSSDKEKRYIKVNINTSEETLTVKLINPLFHELKIKDGLPSSAKPDVEHHGMGLKNVRRICDKYNGELVWNTDNGDFEINARLNLTPKP